MKRILAAFPGRLLMNAARTCAKCAIGRQGNAHHCKTGNMPDDSADQAWKPPEGLIRQESMINTTLRFISKTQTEADLKAIEEANAERSAKITGLKASQIQMAFRDRRTAIQQGGE
jgi:hypothetical protein